MWFPERAMIRTPTIEDARRLSGILQGFGVKDAEQIPSWWASHYTQSAFDYAYFGDHF